MRILAISGSLRAASSNTALVEAAALLALPNAAVTLYTGLGELPHFNPDLDGDTPPPAVADLRAQIQSADALLVCSPEYVHGIPGSLKNALDWIVSSGELMHKPLALINISPRSMFAQAQLTEILMTMMARIVPEASPTLPLAGKNLDAAGIAANLEFAAPLRAALTALVLSVNAASTVA